MDIKKHEEEYQLIANKLNQQESFMSTIQDLTRSRTKSFSKNSIYEEKENLLDNDFFDTYTENNLFFHKNGIICEDIITHKTHQPRQKKGKNSIIKENEFILEIKPTKANGLLLVNDSENITGSKYLEIIYSNVGYNSAQFIMLLIAFLIISLEGIQFYVTSALIKPFMNYYIFPERKIELMSSIMFIGVGTGSFSLSILNKYFTRVNLIQMNIISLIFFHMLWTLAMDIVMICIIKFFMGLFLGVLIPLTITILCEYLPMHFRGLTLTSVWLGFTFGQLITLCNISIIMPLFEFFKVEKYLISLIPYHLVVFLIVFLFLKDSPRNLLVNGHSEEAFIIIENMLKRDLTHEEKELLKDQVVLENEKDSFNNFYHSEYFSISVVICFIGLIGSMLIYGPMLLSNLEISNKDNGTTNEGNIAKMVLLVLVSGIANPIGGFLTEIEFFGRRRSCATASLIGVFSGLMMIAFPESKLIFEAILSFSAFLFINVFSSYMLELFPTKYRGIAVSMFYTSMRIGGFTSQFIFVFLFMTTPILPYCAYSLLFLITIMLLYLLPYDTSGRPLDS